MGDGDAAFVAEALPDGGAARLGQLEGLGVVLDEADELTDGRPFDLADALAGDAGELADLAERDAGAARASSRESRLSSRMRRVPPASVQRP